MTEVKFIQRVLVVIVMTVTSCNLHQSGRSSAQRETAKNTTSSASTSTVYVPPGYTIVWEDQFDAATINKENWISGTLRGPTGDLVPGAAGDHLLNAQYAGYVTAEDSYIDDGALMLRNVKDAWVRAMVR